MRPMVVYTQRVDVVEAYGERRDSADQRIGAFLYACGYLPLPLPNAPEIIELLLKRLPIIGIILTGGNNLGKYQGDAPERDQTERLLLEFGLQHKIPVLGFCRGMQIILDYFGNLLVPVKQHVAVQHEIIGRVEQRKVNSYHSMAAKEVKEPLFVIARSNDGVIEAVRHESKQILGIMWHPERNHKFEQTDIRMVRDLFGTWEEGENS